MRRVVDKLFAGHEPFPAWLVGRGLRFLACNQAAETTFPGMCAMSPEALADVLFGPGPFRDSVENAPEVIAAGLHMLRREAARYNDPALWTLLERARSRAKDLPAGHGTATCDDAAPVICPRFNFGGTIVRTISAVVRFDSAAELTTSELRVELMYPADAESEAFFRRGKSDTTDAPAPVRLRG